SRRLARRGEALTFVIEVDGELAGQLSVSPILLGSLRGAAIGYWVSRHVAGRGVAPTAVALAGDYCFTELGLHRLEINIRPENAASLRVVEKLGFRDEGLRRRYLHIDGDWRDHRTFALVAEEVPGGLLERWRRTRARRAGDGADGAPPPGCFRVVDVQGWVLVGLAVILFGYLVPHLVQTRHQLGQSRVEDRFSGTLRIVATGATVRRSAPGEHHGTAGSRP